MKHLLLTAGLLLSSAIAETRVKPVFHLLSQYARQNVAWRQKSLEQKEWVWMLAKRRAPSSFIVMQSLKSDPGVIQALKDQNPYRQTNHFPLPQHLLKHLVDEATEKSYPLLFPTAVFGNVEFIQSFATPEEVTLYINEQRLNISRPLNTLLPDDESEFRGSQAAQKSPMNLENLARAHLDYELQHCKQESDLVEFIARNYMEFNPALYQCLVMSHIVHAAVEVVAQAPSEEQAEVWEVLSSSPFMSKEAKNILQGSLLWQEIHNELHAEDEE